MCTSGVPRHLTRLATRASLQTTRGCHCCSTTRCCCGWRGVPRLGSCHVLPTQKTGQLQLSVVVAANSTSANFSVQHHHYASATPHLRRVSLVSMIVCVHQSGGRQNRLRFLRLFDHHVSTNVFQLSLLVRSLAPWRLSSVIPLDRERHHHTKSSSTEKRTFCIRLPTNSCAMENTALRNLLSRAWATKSQHAGRSNSNHKKTSFRTASALCTLGV